MIFRSFVAYLLVTFVILIVAFAVLMGGYEVAAAAGDSDGSVLLWKLAQACVALFAIVTILLLGTLALAQLDTTQQHQRVDQRHQEGPPPPKRRPGPRGREERRRNE